MRAMAELSEAGAVGVQGEGRLRGGLDPRETLPWEAVGKGPTVTEGADGNTPVQAVAAACWRRGP